MTWLLPQVASSYPLQHTLFVFNPESVGAQQFDEYKTEWHAQRNRGKRCSQVYKQLLEQQRRVPGMKHAMLHIGKDMPRSRVNPAFVSQWNGGTRGGMITYDWCAEDVGVMIVRQHPDGRAVDKEFLWTLPYFDEAGGIKVRLFKGVKTDTRETLRLFIARNQGFVGTTKDYETEIARQLPVHHHYLVEKRYRDEVKDAPEHFLGSRSFDPFIGRGLKKVTIQKGAGLVNGYEVAE